LGHSVARFDSKRECNRNRYCLQPTLKLFTVRIIHWLHCTVSKTKLRVHTSCAQLTDILKRQAQRLCFSKTTFLWVFSTKVPSRNFSRSKKSTDEFQHFSGLVGNLSIFLLTAYTNTITRMKLQWYAIFMHWKPQTNIQTITVSQFTVHITAPKCNQLTAEMHIKHVHNHAVTINYFLQGMWNKSMSATTYAAAINRYLLPARPTAANLQPWRAADAWDTDRRTDARQLHRPCSTYYTSCADKFCMQPIWQLTSINVHPVV